MANSRLEWKGLDELRAELRRLPSEMVSEATGIIHDAAARAAVSVQSHYPKRTGDLKKGVKVVKVFAGQWGAGAAVRNTSNLAYIFENGSQARHTKIGANRGSMPPGHVFIPTMRIHRRAMYAHLRALVASKGLEVSGDE